MDLRRERRNTNRLIGILVVLVLLVITVILWMVLHPEWRTLFQNAQGSGNQAGALSPSAASDFQETPEDRLLYKINETPVFPTRDSEGDLGIEHSAEGRFLLVVELTLKGSDEVLYRSGYLVPGQQVLKAPLAIPLEAGTYSAVAYFCAIDPETMALFEITEQPITLTVQEESA